MTPPSLAVIWIDWYAYHIARFRALAEHASLRDRVFGIELVGGVGVHAGLRFREANRQELPIATLMPEASWSETSGLKLAWLLWQRLEALEPTVVLIPGYYTWPAVVAALWGRLRGARTVLMSESTRADHARTPLKEMLKGALIRLLFEYAVVGGVRHREYLRRLGFRDARIADRYDVVDNTFFEEGTERYRTAGPPEPLRRLAPYFLYVGRLAEEKNLELLLQSYAHYVADGGSWRLVLAGDGPCRPGLTALAESLGISPLVEFTGHRTTIELLPLYAFASAFVLPSRREPWGLVVNEAMASGLPVIVSNICGAAADLVIEGENGFTFEASRGEALRALLHTVAEAGPERLQAMGERSRSIIRDYSPQRWAAEVARIAAA